MKISIAVILSLALVIAMILPVSVPVSAISPSPVNAVFYSRSLPEVGKIYVSSVPPPPSLEAIAAAVGAPDDNAYIQLGAGAFIIMKFPGNYFAARDGTSNPDLRIDVSGATLRSSAEVFISADGSTWQSEGIKEDTSNIDIDLDPYSGPPIKYVKIAQNFSGINPDTPDRGFDLDAVISLWPVPMWISSVGAVSLGSPSTPLSGVPIYYSVSGGLPPPQTRSTYFLFYTAVGRAIELTAPLVYNDGSNYWVFRRWGLGATGTPPPLPGQPMYQVTIAFTPNTDTTANALYQQISFGPLSPQTPEFNQVGTNHTLSIDLTALPGPEPTTPTLAGIPISFTINGPNTAASGAVVTDAFGRATFTYTGNNDGIDNIYAFIDGNNDGVWEAGEPRSTNDSIKSWIENFVTAGGNIKNGNKVTWTFGGAVGILGNKIVGDFELIDHINKVAYHSNEFSALNFQGPPTNSPAASHNTAYFTGDFTNNRDASTISLVIWLGDAGEPGTKVDSISVKTGVGGVPGAIWIGTLNPDWTPPPPANPYALPVIINGGNIQVHNIK